MESDEISEGDVDDSPRDDNHDDFHESEDIDESLADDDCDDFLEDDDVDKSLYVDVDDVDLVSE